jgi:DNA-binding PadR family transcriptional regulator
MRRAPRSPWQRTPLALAVLELLHEKPMHPYEMQQFVRERGLSHVIRLKAGSLYSTVERLAAAGLIEAGETSREGRRPERTVYSLTEAGSDELQSWMRDLVSQPVPEYPWFGATLAFIAMIPREEAVQLLEYRCIRLEAEVVAHESVQQNMGRLGLPRLFTIEAEYGQALRRAELAWVRRIVEEIRTEKLEWPREVLAAPEQKEKEEQG